MSAEATGWVWKYGPSRSARDKARFLVHLAIADTVSDTYGNEFYMRTGELARKARVSRSMAIASVQELIADGLLEILEVPGETVAGRYRFIFREDLPVIFESRRARRQGVKPHDTPTNGQVREPETPSTPTGVAPSRTPEEAGVAPHDTPSVDDLAGDRAPCATGEQEVRDDRAVVRDHRAQIPTEPNPTQGDPNLATPAGVALVDIAGDGTVTLLDKHRGRPRDELWDATVEAFELDPSTINEVERGRINRALKLLRQSGAQPDEIAIRLAAYTALFPGAARTPIALAGRWTECEPTRVGSVVGAQQLGANRNRLALAQAVGALDERDGEEREF